MSKSVFSDIVPAYQKWIETLADIKTALGNGRRSWRLLAYMTDDGYELYERKSKKIKLIGTFNKSTTSRDVAKLKKKLKKAGADKDSQISLRLSSGNVLQKNIQLPQGAADVLEPVIQNQMRRLVPWAENDTCFSYQINKDRSSAGELDITIVAQSRAYIENAMEELKGLNFNVSTTDFADSVDSPSSLELLNTDNTFRKQNIASVNRVIIGGALISLSISALGIFSLSEKWLQYQQSSVTLENAKNTLTGLKERNADNVRLTAQKSLLIRKKKERLPLILVLDNLSKTIPDNAWLQKLEVNDGKVTIYGNATNTPDLVRTLEASPILKKVGFSAPVTRVGVADLENFSIVADITEGAKSKGRTQ